MNPSEMRDELADLRARLSIDQDVDIRLAGMLRARGIDVLTTLEAKRLGMPDDDQLRFAVSNSRAIVTHNRGDFETLHRDWLEHGRPHFGIVVAVVRRDLSVTRDRVLGILDQHDGDQLRNLLLVA